MIRPVLLLGSEPRIVLPIARCLHERGIPVAMADFGAAGPAARSRAITHILRLPSPPNLFLSALDDAIGKNQYDLLIPTSDSTLLAVSAVYEPLQQRLQICSPPPAIVDLVLDKNKTLSLAQELGIAVPKSYSLPTLAHLKHGLEQISFPLVAKPSFKNKQAGFKVVYFANPAELEMAFAADPLLGTKVLFQEYCPGEGVGINLLLHQGRPLAVFQHRRLKELPASGGVSVLAISEPVDPVLQEIALKLLARMGWEGVAMVEFRQDRKSGQCVLMEVNGRYWGSIAAPLKAGIPFPYYQWQLAHGQAPHATSSYRNNMRTRWLAGDILRLHGVWRPSANRIGPPRRMRELARFFTDFRPRTKDMVFCLTDPLPGLLEVLQVARALAASEVKRLLRATLPARCRERIALYRSLGRPLAWRYARLRLAHRLGGRQQQLRHLAARAGSFLFVCKGNILRSPMAAALFQDRLPSHLRHLQVMSAGVGDLPEGRSDPRAQAAAVHFGISLDGHTSRRITETMLESADIVLAMDVLNEASIWQRFPRFRNKVLLLAEAGQKHKSLEISDPYEGDEAEVQACYRQLSHYIDDLIALLPAKAVDAGSKERDLTASS